MFVCVCVYKGLWGEEWESEEKRPYKRSLFLDNIISLVMCNDV